MFHGKIKPSEAGITPTFIPLSPRVEDYLDTVGDLVDELVGTYREVRYGGYVSPQSGLVMDSRVQGIAGQIKAAARDAAEAAEMSGS